MADSAVPEIVPDTSDPSAPSLGERDAAGRFLPGNVAAVKHGFDARELPPELAQLNDQIEAFVAGCLVDEADPDVPTRRKALLEYRARLHRRIVQLDAALESRTMFDRQSKLRTGWLQRLEGLINTAKALDNVLGLERKAKPVASPVDWIEGRA